MTNGTYHPEPSGDLPGATNKGMSAGDRSGSLPRSASEQTSPRHASASPYTREGTLDSDRNSGETSDDDGAFFGPPSSFRVEEVGDVPPLGATYRTVLGRSAQAVLASRPAAGLPEVALAAGPVRADAEHLTAYQHLVGAPVDDTLPPGFVHVLAFPLAVALMARADFPFSPLGMIHVSNRITQTRPVRLGEELTVTAWAHDAREHKRGTTVDLSVLARTSKGEPVWSGRATYLAKGSAPTGLDRGPAAEERPRVEIPHRPQALWAVSESDIHTYAQVSRDRNPIHTSRLGARAFGFPRRIAHGMYTAARALHAAGRPGSTTWDVEFGSPVILPAKVAYAQVNDVMQASGAPYAGAVEHREADNGPITTRSVVWDPKRGKVHATTVVTTAGS
ncbi:MaoC/PaaZ C-terminal domain-containing protein [Georgenia sp. Z1344]|uniref:MaoC/PaaZ C-terminal domain-containing protein n=1 Tax=Georgenia sp. Z1344 TaxID=3416706 RepID=UPI003CF23180